MAVNKVGIFAHEGFGVAYINADFMSDRNATIVRVTTGDYEVTGASKRAAGDSYDAEVGIRLAFARALHKLADQIESETDVP